MKFKLYGTMFFEAKNIDDAFSKVAEHFLSLANAGDGIKLLPGTDINIKPDEDGVCQICGEELEPILENNGFDEPDPTHYEITGYKPCKCHKEL